MSSPVFQRKAQPKLFTAAGNGNIEAVKILLENGADPNIINDNGWTPLMLATRYANNVDIVKLLLNNGADPNIINNDGWTALMLSARYSNTDEIVKLLLENGTNPNIRNKDGWTALMLSARYSHTDEIAKLLLNNGADPNIRNNDGWTALMMSARYSNTNEIIKILLENGADPNIKTNSGGTALMISAFYTNTETVKLLLENGADPFIIKLIPNMQMPKENEQLLSEYQWKRLYQRDKDTARRYAKNGELSLPKEIWEIILLHKRQQMLCQNLSSNKNKEILYLFALEIGIVIPDKDKITKGKLCTLISRHLTYGNEPNRQSQIEKDIDRHKNVIKNLAFVYGIDPNKPLSEILSQLSNAF